MSGLYGVDRAIWRRAGLIPCRLAWGLTIHRLRKLLDEADPYPSWTVDPCDIETWCDGEVAPFVRRRKVAARARRTLQHALVAQRLQSRCFDGGDFVPVPSWAWSRTDRIEYVWSENRLLFDALLPEEWARLSRCCCFIDRASFATWLAQALPFVTLEDLADLPSLESPPPRVKSRLPALRPYVPLSEAVSWLGYGVALKRDDLFELMQTGEIGEGVEWAESRIADAVERIADSALAGQIRCLGKHRKGVLDHKGVLTEEIPAIKFFDYRRFDPVYEGLFFGNGLNHIMRDSVLRTLGGDGREDFYGSVQIRRDDLIQHFAPSSQPAAAQSRHVRVKTLARIGEGTLRSWFEGLGASADATSQALLLAMARERFPRSRITREQIRLLTMGRKPGPKPIRPESPAY